MPLPDWEGGSDSEFAKFLDHDEGVNPGGYQTYVDPDFTQKLDGLADENLEDLIDALSLKKWDKKGQTVSDHDTNNKHLAMAEDELRKRQEPLHQKAMDELEGMEGDLEDAGPSLQDITDDALDAEIMEFNKILNSGFEVENQSPSIFESYKEHLQNLVNERRRRRKNKGDSGEAYGYPGGGGSAGAQKAQGSIDQMMQESGKVPADLPDMPGGAIGKLAYNIENFHADADIGDVPRILENAKFVSKRNMWNFPIDPDVGVFDLNGFFNRMSHPKHELNTDEITVLARVLEQAKSYPSKRNLSSMAEDLYKTMVSGPAKSALEGIGFNIQ